MLTDELRQLRTLHEVYAIKLHRLENKYQHSLRKLNKEETQLNKLKQEAQAAQENYIQENERWQNKIETVTQEKETLLEMRYALHSLKETINHIQTKKEEQQQAVINIQKTTQALKDAVIQMNIKIEKLTLLQTDIV